MEDILPSRPTDIFILALAAYVSWGHAKYQSQSVQRRSHTGFVPNASLELHLGSNAKYHQQGVPSSVWIGSSRGNTGWSGLFDMIPVRFLIPGTLGKKMAKLFYHLIKNYGRKKTLEFLNIVRAFSDDCHTFVHLK